MKIANADGSTETSTHGKSDLIFYSHSYGRHQKHHGGTCPVCQTDCGWESKGDRVIWCYSEDGGKIEAPQEGPGMAWIKTVKQGSWKAYTSYSLADTLTGKTESAEAKADRLALAAYNEAQAKKEREFKAASLPSNSVRDDYYRTALRPLESADFADLLKRGLTTDEIANAERLGFVGRGPRQTSRAERSYVILSQIDGAIVGGQVAQEPKLIKIDGNGKEVWSAKYIWDNHKFPTKLQGLDAVPHFECAALKTIPNTTETKVLVVEGYLKALVTAIFAARENLDWYILGVSGQSFLSVGSIASRIAEIKAEFPGIQVSIVPDGDVATSGDVFAGYKIATNSGLYDGVLWFGQKEKAQNIDDVSAETRASARVLSIAAYWKTIATVQEAAKTAHVQRYNDATEARKLWFENTGMVLDRSVCGSGKSYTLRAVADQMQSEGLKLAIVDNRYRNAEALEGLTLIQGRHTGLVRDNGNVRTIKAGEDLSKVEFFKPSNCFQAANIAAQTAKGMFSEGQTVREVVCLKCPLRDKCEKSEGQDDKGREYGYNYRRKAIDNTNVHALHPQSLPGHGENDSSNYYTTERHMAYDESESIFSRCFEDQVVTLNDLKTLSIGLPLDSPGQLAVRVLGELCSKAALSHYGLNMDKLQELLTITPESLDAIEAYIQTEQSYLDRLDYPTDTAYLEAINRIMVSSFVKHLRLIIAGMGTATASPEGITLMIRSEWTLTAGNANGVVLDATGDPEELSAALGGITITTVMSAMNNTMPKIVKIGGSKNTSNRSQATRKTNVLINEELVVGYKNKNHDTAIADSGRFLSDYDDIDAVKLKMHVDNVGSNKAKDCHALIINGMPRPNITALKARWEMLAQNGYKRDFDYYYKSKCNQILEQTIHRLRPNRRPNEELTVYILDSSYEGHFDIEMTVEQILGEKASGKAQKVALIRNVLESMNSNGEDGKVSLRKIGELTGISHTHVATLLPQAIALMAALNLDEVIDSLHTAGIESEAELTTIINSIILEAIGLADDDEADDGDGLEMVYEYEPDDDLITA